jgi:hypothetical protein
MPWPLKSSELNRPVVLALAKHVRGSRFDTSKAVADEVVDLLRRAAPQHVESALAAVQAGRRLPYESLLRLEDMARNDEGRYRRLRKLADDSVAMIGRCIQRLSDLGVAGEGGSDIVLMIACGETCYGDGGQADPPPEDPETARYLQLLKWAVARAVDVLARQSGRHCLRLHVLERHVSDPGSPGRTRLQPRHLYPIAREAERRAAPKVTVNVEEVPRYDDRMHAALVLADFVSNRVRRALGGVELALAAVERRIVAEVPCPARSGNPEASHLAAVGFAQEQIERARVANTAAATPPPGARAWAIEQAAEWVRLVTK